MGLKTAWIDLRDAGTKWVDDHANRLSAALAFYTLLSVSPLFVIAVAIAGAVFGHDAATGALSEQLRSLFGEAGAEVARTAIEHAHRPRTGVLATGIGIATLLYGASGAFNALQYALNTMWNVKPKPGRAIWLQVRDQFLSFGMVLVIGFLLLVSLVVTTALAAFGGYLEALAPDAAQLMHVANFVLSFVLVTALFALMFKYLPDAEVAWRDVWFGALVTAALFTAGKYAIGEYLGRAGVATPFGAAGSLVAFVVWVYYSGLIVFFGAELIQVTAQHAGREIQPSANAELALGCRDESGSPSPRPA